MIGLHQTTTKMSYLMCNGITNGSLHEFISSQSSRKKMNKKIEILLQKLIPIHNTHKVLTVLSNYEGLKYITNMSVRS